MRLQEYLRTLGLTSMREAPHSLGVIRAFTFGEYYQIILLSGAKVEFNDLDELLDCMKDEFRAAPTYDYEIGVVRSFSKAVLNVEPRNCMGRPFGRNTKELSDTVRGATTLFNLTGEWPETIPTLGRI